MEDLLAVITPKTAVKPSTPTNPTAATIQVRNRIGPPWGRADRSLPQMPEPPSSVYPMVRSRRPDYAPLESKQRGFTGARRWQDSVCAREYKKEERMIRVLRVAAFAAALTMIVPEAASAQATGSIFGKVTDASGGVLPGVTVTVSGPTLQQPLMQVTAGSGAYQFPVVPIGTFSVKFELTGFKTVTRPNIVVVTGQNVPLDMKLEVGAMSEELTVSAAAPVVDTKKTNSGATFSSEILEKIPTARDPWQIINMTPGVQAGLNVGGSSSGQQVGLSSRGTGANVQWNLEGGSITDLSSNSSPAYFNFDSFDQISVTNGGGDVSVQSSGLSINLVTKSGSNVLKGSAVGTFQHDKIQGNNVTEEQFVRGTSGFLSGAPIKKIYNISGEYGGPIIKNRLWWWAAADKQYIDAGVVNFFDRSAGADCVTYADAQRSGTLVTSGTSGTVIKYSDLGKVQDCLSPDTTIIK